MITIRHDKLKARKDHICSFCCENIEKNNQYYNSAHVYEGSVYTWKSHIDCARLLSLLNMDGDEGVTQEIFWEDVKQEYYNLIAKLPDSEKLILQKITKISFKQQLDYVIKKKLYEQ